MNIERALKNIGDWISKETESRKYPKSELLELSESLQALKAVSNQYLHDVILTALRQCQKPTDEAVRVAIDWQELRHRLSLAEKVCFEANGYLKSKDNPLGRIYLERLEDAVKKWDNGRPNKGAQYLVMEDWEQC